jgi:hypothetical protein
MQIECFRNTISVFHSRRLPLAHWQPPDFALYVHPVFFIAKAVGLRHACRPIAVDLPNPQSYGASAIEVMVHYVFRALKIRDPRGS